MAMHIFIACKSQAQRLVSVWHAGISKKKKKKAHAEKYIVGHCFDLVRTVSSAELDVSQENYCTT